jgi:GTPase SAR1 family protein
MEQFINMDTCSFIVVGNKTDLNRKVDYDEAKKLADDMNFLYLETSTKEGSGIQDVFETLAENIINKKQQLQQQKSQQTKKRTKKGKCNII